MGTTTAVIADASALIALAEVAQLSLLEGVFGAVLVPPAVAREVAPSLPSLPPWIEVRAPQREPDARVLAANLGAGESEALCLGLETPASWLILDDDRARRLARQLGLKRLGTAAVLVEAKRAGLIPAVRPILDALLAKGFRLSPKVYEAILGIAGEKG
jgi:hypothetical protein